MPNIWKSSDAPGRATAVLVAMIAAPGPSALPAFAAPKAVKTACSLTATPIHHLVVIFQENVSFDHY